MLQLLAPLVLLFITLPGCAQQKPVAEKGYAFYRISIPGNIPVDDQGNPEHRIDTVYQVYMETGNFEPDIAFVVLNGWRYQAVPVSIDEVEVGKKASDNESILLKAKPGYSLWQLDLSEHGDVAERKGNAIAIRDRQQKIRYLALPHPVELVREERY